MSAKNNLKVLIVSTEVSPYSKSGGLGDVVGSLPKELKKKGIDARVVFPKYRSIKAEYQKDMRYIDSFTLTLSWRKQSVSIHSLDAEVPTYLIENDYYFGRDGFYGYSDDFERFAFFSKASVEFLGNIDFQPDVIHFNDWQTGLGSVYLRDVYGGFLFYSKIKSLFTIHNLQYQGVFGREILSTIDLNDGYFRDDKLEFYGNISYMKAGLVYADAISTVSETYAREIQTIPYSYGMDGILCSKSDKLYGILNGIDYDSNNPLTDPKIFCNYDLFDLQKKKENKHKLQEMLNLPQRDVPVIAIISRLVDQKGFDLIGVAMDELASMDIQLIVLGTGDGRYENLFRTYAWRFPEKVSANITFDASMAQKIYSGADMFLMPSLFEPCGLGQLIAMRYGTVPIVRKTGGLADTVTHYDPESKTGNGFVFEDYVASGMMWAVRQALDIYYSNREDWQVLVRNGMSCDFSWSKSADRYIELYEKLRDSK